MNRRMSLPWVVTLLASLAGCATSDEFKSAATTQASQATASGSGAAVAEAAGDPVAVQVLGEARPDSMNLFPADFGNAPLIDGRERLVPQERGQDNRPAEMTLYSQAEPEQTPRDFATTPAGTLVLYDSTGPYGWLGELYGIATLNLASHFGTTASKPVVQYKAGDLANYKAVIYVGSTYDEPLPVAFLDDVLNTTTPVIWIYDNIWQLANRSTGFVAKYGYNPWAFDVTAISKVTYKGKTLTRDASNGSGILQLNPFDATKVTTLASAVRSNGTTFPWAVRSANLTYVGEVPYAYINHDDRYLAFCDMLFDVLAPTAPTQHRALLRLEDVSPTTSAASFKAIVDYLYSQSVPFSIAVIPLYKDPLNYEGMGATVKWTQKATMLKNLKYALTRGGTIVMHGYTHQFNQKLNPYSAVSGDDFEFFASHVDKATQNVIYDGAVSGDSATWALGRINSGLAALAAAGLPVPTIFEYPHYAGSPVDSRTIRTVFGQAYHRGLYFTGDLGLTPKNLSHMIGLFYPYTVTDIYGWKVYPENLGAYELDPYNNHPARLAVDIVATAQNNLVIRDGVASFYFHPYNPLSALKSIVTGVKAAGYTFVSPSAL